MNPTTVREKVQDLIDKFRQEQAAGVIGQVRPTETPD